jgi:hypothetical protein
MKPSKRIQVTFILLSFTLTGCTAYNPVQLRQQQLNDHYTYFRTDPPLYEGDVIQYKLKDGRQNIRIVQRTTPHGIITNTSQFIDFKDMTALERREISKVKTATAMVTGTMLVPVAVLGMSLGVVIVALLFG